MSGPADGRSRYHFRLPPHFGVWSREQLDRLEGATAVAAGIVALAGQRHADDLAHPARQLSSFPFPEGEEEVEGEDLRTPEMGGVPVEPHRIVPDRGLGQFRYSGWTPSVQWFQYRCLDPSTPVRHSSR